MAITNAVLDELLKDYQTPDDLSGQHGILKRLTKALIERAMQAEMTHHLGYEKHDAAGDHSGNSAAIRVGPEQDNAQQAVAAEFRRFFGLGMPFCTVKLAV